MNFVLWVVASVVMFRTTAELLPFCVAMATSFVLALVRTRMRRKTMARLVAQYTEENGEPPPGFDTKATQVGGAVGAVVGNYVAGGLIGAALDGVRHTWNRRNMDEQQRALHDKITALQSWTPWQGTWMLFCGLTLSWMALWVRQVVAGH